MNFQEIKSAIQAFDEMPQRNEASVGAAISGFSQNGFSREAIAVFRDIGVRRFRPNSVMIAGVLSACDVIEHGVQAHCWAAKIGVERDVYVGTALVTMYMTCSDADLATKVFGMMDYKNVVSYNAFISGLVQNGVIRTVFNVFKDMLKSSQEMPNLVTLVSVLGACANSQSLQYGIQVHGIAVKLGLQFDTMVGTALVDMYAKCGCSHLGYDVFRELSGNRNLITWNSIISGMLFNGECHNALELFSDLESEGLMPDSATWNTMINGFSRLGKCTEAFEFFTKMISGGVAPTLKSLTSLLPACCMTSSLRWGKEIHAHAIRASMSDDEFFATSLIDMYMKCGQSSWARRIFNQFRIKPVEPPFWNAMISGYGRNGEGELALEIFDLMLEGNVQPNSATFLSVLSVCNYSGKVDKGLQVLEMMSRDYSLNPSPQHFACVIYLLVRAGYLNKAQELMHEMPEISSSVLSSLLVAAGHNLDSQHGENIAEKLSELDPEDSISLVALSNLYATMGRWKDVEWIRNMMDAREVKKHAAYSIGMT